MLICCSFFVVVFGLFGFFFGIFPLDGTSFMLDFGLPSPFGAPLEGGVSRGKHVLAGFFQQPGAQRAMGTELPTAFVNYLGSSAGCGAQ